jgi:beta-lactamase class A
MLLFRNTRKTEPAPRGISRRSSFVGSRAPRPIALLTFLLAAGTLAATELPDRVLAHIERSGGAVSFFAKNIDTGRTLELRADERVRTASTIKLPILCAVFAAVHRGEARWNEMLTLRDREKVSGSGVVREFSGNLRLPLRDLARVMIVVSDNTATNMILDRFSADFVNAEMDRLGLLQTRSLRKILGDGSDLKAQPSGFSAEGRKPENQRFGIGVSTAREMVMLLESIERGQVVSPAASREIIEILKRQQYKDGIGRRLSHNVASKSGALDALRSDVGIVYAPGGRIAMAITVEALPKIDYTADNVGNILIADLAVTLVGVLVSK